MRMQRSVHRAYGRHTARLTIAALLLSLLTVFGVGAPAYADDPNNWGNCDVWGAVTYFWTDQDGGYWYTNARNVPSSSWSSCNDINATYDPGNPTGAFTIRIRFYNLQNGTNYANAWKSACAICWALAATNVINSTHYRIETRGWESLTVYD